VCAEIKVFVWCDLIRELDVSTPVVMIMSYEGRSQSRSMVSKISRAGDTMISIYFANTRSSGSSPVSCLGHTNRPVAGVSGSVPEIASNIVIVQSACRNFEHSPVIRRPQNLKKTIQWRVPLSRTPAADAQSKDPGVPAHARVAAASCLAKGIRSTMSGLDQFNGRKKQKNLLRLVA
jgi:hypothetical protein